MHIAKGFSSVADNPTQNETSNNPPDMDPSMLQTLSHLLGKINQTGSRPENLLRSIEPYLKKSRQQALEKAFRLTKLAKAAKFAIKEFPGGEDSV